MSSYYKPICAVCNDYYSDPRVLPCGHTFCYDCLFNLYNSGQPCVKCAKCGKQHHLERDTIETLASNYDVASCADAYKCKKQTSTCTLHQDCNVVYYCTSCKQTACHKCVLVDGVHFKHDVVDLDTGLQLMTELYQQLLRSVTDLLGSWVDKSVQRKQHLRQLQLDVIVAIDKVNQRIDEFKSEVDSIRLQLIVQIGSIASKCANAVCSRVDLLKLRQLNYLTAKSAEQLKFTITQQNATLMTRELTSNEAKSERLRQLHSDVLDTVTVQPSAAGNLVHAELSKKLGWLHKFAQELNDRAIMLTVGKIYRNPKGTVTVTVKRQRPIMQVSFSLAMTMKWTTT